MFHCPRFIPAAILECLECKSMMFYPRAPSSTDTFVQSHSQTDSHCVCPAVWGGPKRAVPGHSHPNTHQQEVGKQRSSGQSRRHTRRHHEGDGRQADLSEWGGQMCVRIHRRLELWVGAGLKISFLSHTSFAFLLTVGYVPTNHTVMA